MRQNNPQSSEVNLHPNNRFHSIAKKLAFLVTLAGGVAGPLPSISINSGSHIESSAEASKEGLKKKKCKEERDIILTALLGREKSVRRMYGVLDEKVETKPSNKGVEKIGEHVFEIREATKTYREKTIYVLRDKETGREFPVGPESKYSTSQHKIIGIDAVKAEYEGENKVMQAVCTKGSQDAPSKMTYNSQGVAHANPSEHSKSNQSHQRKGKH